MASAIVNVNSALNYIATKSGLPIGVVRGWYPNALEDDKRALNVKSAFNIFARMVKIGFGATISIPAIANVQTACSSTTLKNIYSYVMGSRVWNIKTTFGTLKYGKAIYTLKPASFRVNLIGGGGGSAGTVTGYSAKNNAHDVYGSSGGGGSNTYIRINDTQVSTAAGGSGGSQSYVRANANDDWVASAGANGAAGSSIYYDMSLNIGDKLFVTQGNGGGGGGGVIGYRAEVNSATGSASNGSYGTQQQGAGGKAQRYGDTSNGAYGGGSGGTSNGNSPGSGGQSVGVSSGKASTDKNLYFGTFNRGASYNSSTGGGQSMGAAGRIVAGSNGTAYGGQGGASGGIKYVSGDSSYYFNIIE